MYKRTLYCIYIILGTLFATGISANAADTTAHLQLIRSISGQYANMWVDNMQNVYLLSKETNQLKKLKSSGDSMAVFNDVKKYGNIYSLDVTNPLNILAYYKDYTTIIVLDRFLNPVKTIDLRQSGILQCRAVGYSYDNNIWVYDQQENKLKKIDNNGTVLFSSDDFRIIFSEAPNPKYIIDNDGQLYLYDEQKGWFIFDYYGAFKTQYSYTNWLDVTVINQLLIGRKDSVFYIGNPKTYDLQTIQSDIPLQNKDKIYFELDKAFVLSTTGIDIYTVSNL